MIHLQARRVLLLISDTGGGHRACATALRDALLEINPAIEVEIVDALKEAGAFPMPHMPRLYTRWSENRRLWGTFFHATNGRRWSNVVTYPLQRRTRPSLRRLVMSRNPDLVVVLHPCLTNVTYQTLAGLPNRPRVVTAITDLVYGHASWFSHGADFYYLPTESMRRHALRQRLDPDKLKITGLPLATRLFDLRDRKREIRAELGYERMTVVCVGGADGMGIERLAPSLSTVSPEVDIHVICGKNTALKTRLDRQQLPPNLHVHGFVRNLPEMLAATDIALIKASPTVLMEAITVGARVLLYDYVPGQERPNIGFVRENGLGDYSRSPKKIARMIDEIAAEWTPESFGAPRTDFIPLDGARILAAELLEPDLFLQTT